MDVPLSHSNPLYGLHVRYVIERLRALQQRRGDGHEAFASVVPNPDHHS